MNRKDYRVLAVDDEQAFVLLLRRIIEGEGYTVRTASDGNEALTVARSFMPHLLIVDLKMPGMDGITLIEKYKEVDREADFLVLTAFGTLDTALRAMKMGVIDYILKPLKEPEELRLAVRKAYSQKKLLHKDHEKINDLDTELPPMEVLFAGTDDLLQEIQLVSMTNATILLAGETGTGKSMIARVLHKLSQRKGPF